MAQSFGELGLNPTASVNNGAATPLAQLLADYFAYRAERHCRDRLRQSLPRTRSSAASHLKQVTARRLWLVEGRELDGNVVYRQANPLHHFSDQQMGAIALQRSGVRFSLSSTSRRSHRSSNMGACKAIGLARPWASWLR